MEIAAGSSYFLSGVMQSSGSGSTKDYRASIRQAILSADANAKIIDPLILVEDRCRSLHVPDTPPEDMWKDDSAVRRMFTECVETAAQADIVVSFLPSASMGSAIEIYSAKAAGRLILVVAPGKMSSNWVVRSYADAIFEDIDGLHECLKASVAQ